MTTCAKIWEYDDVMTSERLNIPESVADFIQGRVPKSIEAELRRKAGLIPT